MTVGKPVKMVVDEFGKAPVIIDRDHPLAVQQRKRDAGETIAPKRAKPAKVASVRRKVVAKATRARPVARKPLVTEEKVEAVRVPSTPQEVE